MQLHRRSIRTRQHNKLCWLHNGFQLLPGSLQLSPKPVRHEGSVWTLIRNSMERATREDQLLWDITASDSFHITRRHAAALSASRQNLCLATDLQFLSVSAELGLGISKLHREMLLLLFGQPS